MLSSSCPRGNSLHLCSSSLGLPLRGSSGRSPGISSLDRPLDEGYLPAWTEALPSTLCIALLYEGQAADIQQSTRSDPELSTLWRRSQRLWRASEVPQS